MISSSLIVNLFKSCESLKQWSLSPLIENDATYQQDLKDCTALEIRLEQLAIGSGQRMVISDYIACKNSLTAQYSNLSYLADFHDCIQVLALFQNSQQSLLDVLCAESTNTDNL
ncbi:hypothetical protein LQE96_03555 [Phocea massiliensis]|uniref:Uncharacterized protein n=1 Tax=uncultured Anaerotruncus sp. TaxID=905011 RepID=A0A6N2T9A8_9FIRM|nr:hypothetical protein [Merdimmobilis hominis]MCD4835910.1 hypothetical protein [Merdimmobilis hominis]